MSKKSLYFPFSLIILVLMCMGTLYSQVGQTGSIRGTVTADDGQSLPAVTVTIRSPALVLPKRVTVTNVNGQYRFHSLAPGIYQITFSLEGFNTIVRKGIRVNANSTVTVGVGMQLKTIEEQVEVRGKAPTVDRQSTAMNTSMSTEFLKSIPTSRSLNALVNLTPGVNGGVSMGAGARDNNYNMDGVNTNDPETGTNAASFNIDIIEEVSVQTGGISAEHAGGSGAVINVITKSGGNRVSGSLTVYYTNEDLLGDNTGDFPDLSEPSGNKFEVEPGFTLGGPVIKDKLWFFTSLNFYKSESRIPNFPALSDEEVFQPTTSVTPYGKLTFAPDERNKFQATFSFDARKVGYSNAVWWRDIDATTDFKQKTTTAAFHWNHIFGNNFYTNFSVAYFKRKLDWINNGDGTSYWDAVNEVQYGSNGMDDLNDRQRLQFNMDGTLFIDNLAGTHEAKFGVQFQKAFWIREINVYGPDDGHGQHLGWVDIFDGNWRDRYYWADFLSRVDLQKIGFFFNDTWNIGKHLTLTIGLRYDIDSTIFPKSTDTSEMSAPSGDFGYIGSPGDTWNMVVEKRITAYTWNNFSPRFGLIYDIGANGKTLLKATYARYTASNYSFYAAYLNPVNWVGYADGIDPGGNVYALWWTRVPGTSTVAGYKDHKLKAPISHEVSVSVERELFEDWSLSLRYTRRWDRNLIETADASQLDLDALLDDGEYVWTNWTPHTFADPVTGNNLTAWSQNGYVSSRNHIINPPDAKRDYNGLEITLKKRFSRGWQLQASYVNNNSKGLMSNSFSTFDAISTFYNDPNAHENAYGQLPLERRHEFKLSGLMRGPFGFNISGKVRYLSGYPYSRSVNPRDLGVSAVRQGTWIFAEPRGSYNMDDLFLVDLRLEKQFKFGKTISFNLFAEVFNLLNGDAVTSLETNDASWTEFQKVYGLQFPRYFRFGARIDF